MEIVLKQQQLQQLAQINKEKRVYGNEQQFESYSFHFFSILAYLRTFYTGMANDKAGPIEHTFLHFTDLKSSEGRTLVAQKRQSTNSETLKVEIWSVGKKS